MVLNSLSELGPVFGIPPRKPRKERTYFCRNCGKALRRVGESNVYLCDGVNKDNKPCNGRFILPIRKALAS